MPTGRSVVLVVDDDARNRALVAAMLEGAYDVAQAHDADAALVELRRRPVDLVLLDVMMPGRSGYDALADVRGTSPDLFLPVLMLTALGTQEHRNRGLAAGADDYLTKPVDRRELLLRVAAFLRIREQERVIRRQLADLRQLAALKDDLVSLVVHDLRNPLSGIRLLLGLQQDVADPERADDLRAALRAAEDMQSTLDDMLRVRLLEGGELPLDIAPASIRELLQSAVASLEACARARQVHVRVDAGCDVTLPVDASLVRRAVQNLAANAIKYTPSGEVVDLCVARAAGGAVVTVADRGPGIPAPERGRLFEKFAGLRRGRRDERRGFGLGLYMVRLVAEAHGGRAEVADRAGGGTEFRIELPGP